MPGVDAGSIYSEVRIALDKLRGDITEVEAAFDKLVASNKTDSQQVENNWKKSFSGISLAGTAAIAAVTLAFKSAVKTFATTEQSLANVRAVTGASAEEFAKLEEAAARAGQTTRFRASEAADALYYLASAGFDATQSVEALDGVLLLAGATGSDLAQAAQAVTSTLSQFKLEAKDSEEVVNIFAAAISNSQATLEKIQGSLRQVGPVAGGMNRSLEETVGVLQVLYNAGYQGENAGRALKSALADLGNESSIANQKLADLGISYDQINPKTNNLADVFGVLKKAGIDVTQSLDIFGKVAGSQMGILISAGRDEIEKYTEAVTGTSAAAEQYAIQNDTLSGSFDKFKSALEGTTNSIIKTLAPAFRLILDSLASVLNAFTKLPSALKGLVGGFGTAFLAIQSVTRALSLLGVSASAALGPISLIVGAFAGIAIALNEATRKQREYKNNLENLATAAGNLKTESFGLIKEYNELKDKTDKSSTEMERQEEIARELYKLFPDLTEEVLNNANAMNELAIKEAEAAKASAELALQDVKRDMAELQEQINDTAEDIQNNLIQALGQQQEVMGLTAEQAAKQSRQFEKMKKEIRGFRTLEEFTAFAKKMGINLDSMAGGFQNLNRQVDISQEAIDFYQAQIDEATETIEENTKAINDNADANKNQSLSVEDQIKARKAAESELEVITARIQQERDLGLISEEDKIKKIIAANEKLIRSLLDIGYTGKTTEFGDQAIRRALALIEILRASLEDTNKKVTEDEAKTTQDIIDFYNQRANQRGAIREHELAENQKKLDKEKEQEERNATAILLIRQQLANGAIDLYQTVVSSLNAAYQADRDNEIKAVQEKVDAKVISEEEGEKLIAKINYEKDLADWKSQNAAIIGNIAQAVSVALASSPFPLNLIPIGFATAKGAIQLATQSKTKPKPPKLATGGIILPETGGTTAVLAENNAPELALNLGQEGNALLDEFARRVASVGSSSGQFTLIIMRDGRKDAESVVKYINGGVVRLDI